MAGSHGKSAAEPLALDVSDPAFQRDPYPTYRRFRERDPVHFERIDGTLPIWFVFRYEDVVEVLQSDRFSSVELEPPEGVEIPATLAPIVELFRNVMLTRDPPEHTRLRALVGKAFTPRMVEHLRPRVEQIMEQLLEAAIERGELDLVRDIGVPLPLIVIAELLGVPAEDQEKLKRWSDDIAPMLDGSIRDAALPRIVAAAIQLRDYLAEALDERRRHPREDLLSALLEAQQADDRLTDLEIVATSLLVLGAGHETTTNLIGNGMYALLRHPDQMALLRAEPERVPAAVEEMLRYDSPVQLTGRRPRTDVVIGGVSIPAGQEVDVILGSANRDPSVFPDPERFDVTRQESRHLSFGRGVHFCLGAALARLEGAVAVQTLLERLPDLAPVACTPARREGVVLRGLVRLPVRY